MSQKDRTTMLKDAYQLLSQYTLCSHCLGRQFALLATGTSNLDRGNAIKLLLTMQGYQLLEEGNEKGETFLRFIAEKGRFQAARDSLTKKDISFDPAKESCYICHDLFSHIPDKVTEALERLKPYNYDNFVAGSKVPPAMIEREDQLRMQFGLSWGEAIKREINREFGKIFSERSSKPVDFDHPQMNIIWDIEGNQVEIQSSPVFVYGHYRKLIRGIPQTRWPCRLCQGKGCEECKGTGKRYETSVEEQINETFIQSFQATDGKFHGAGREDIDARMLGSGRPFVFELIKPQIRVTDLEKLQQTTNKKAKGKVEVLGLKYSTMDVMRRLKAFASQSSKTYKALIRVEQPIQDSQLVQLDSALSGTIIQQQTPIRVKHRRADRIRKKQIYTCKSNLVDDMHFIAEIQCQGGLYIKELVTGDEDRTRPNMAQLLGIPAKVQELDVIQVESESLKNGKEPPRASA